MMSEENKLSVQLGKYIAPIEKVALGKNGTPGFQVNYVRLDDGLNKLNNVKYFSGKLDDKSKEVLRALKDGDEFVIVKEQVGGFFNFKEFRKADTFVATPKKPYNPGGYSNAGSKASGGGGYDSLGNQIGNCITNAVNSLGEGKSISEYKDRALIFILMGDELRLEVEAKRLIAKSEITPPSNKQKEEDEDDNLPW